MRIFEYKLFLLLDPKLNTQHQMSNVRNADLVD